MCSDFSWKCSCTGYRFQCYYFKFVAFFRLNPLILVSILIVEQGFGLTWNILPQKCAEIVIYQMQWYRFESKSVTLSKVTRRYETNRFTNWSSEVSLVDAWLFAVNILGAVTIKLRLVFGTRMSVYNFIQLKEMCNTTLIQRTVPSEELQKTILEEKKT